MLRSLVSLALGIALVGGSPVNATAATDVRPAAAADRSAPSMVPTVVERRVRLGHRPIRLHPDSRTVRLTFHGRRGQLVHLASWSDDKPCLTTRLRRRDSRRDRRPWAEGYWKLRATGMHTVVAKRCDGTAVQVQSKVQVRKAVVRQAEVDGPSIRIGFNQDVTHLVKVPLAAGERLKVDNSWTVTHILLPGHDTPERVARERIYLEAGTQPAYGAAVSSAGDHYLVGRPDQRGTIPDGPVRVTRVLRHGGQLDGPEVTLPNFGVAERTHVVTFDAPAGAWVYGVATTSSGTVAATGAVLDGAGRSMTHYGATQVPSTGTYRMQVTAPQSLGDDDSIRLRIRTAAVAESLVIDGPDVTYAAGTPGQWVVGPYTEGIGYASADVAVSDIAPPGTSWRATLYSGRANNCPPDDTSMGCGDYFFTPLGPDRTSAPVAQDAHVGPSIVVVTFPPTVQGSLKLTLTSR